jgi:hypothetical protein
VGGNRGWRGLLASRFRIGPESRERVIQRAAHQGQSVQLQLPDGLVVAANARGHVAHVSRCPAVETVAEDQVPQLGGQAAKEVRQA